MIDIFNTDAFSMLTLAAAVKKIPYKPSRLGPGGLALFDEKPMATLTAMIEQVNGQLSLIQTSPRGSSGDYIADAKRSVISFVAQHLKRNAKIMADEVQGVRVFGSEDMALTIEAKRDEKLATLQAMHEVTWENHRVGALVGKVLDADGTTTLLDVYSAFGVTQTVKDFALTTTTTDIRSVGDGVADAIDEELGATTYDHVHAICGGTFYDTLIMHKFVQDALKAQTGAGAAKILQDLRNGGFTIGAVTYERAKRWRVRNPAGTMIDMVDPNLGYAFPVGATTAEGPMFIGRFAPQPYIDTVNRLNPPLVVKAEAEAKGKWIDLEGISCPLYLNTRPKAVIKLTKS
jgi:hypothetical protein